ncbi:MAG: hypothetical protein BHV77_05315 [Bacteroides sp. 43_108]|nr:MAG: hypothetical protein BHV77_05315 [Bacteroides sp. 43_108]
MNKDRSLHLLIMAVDVFLLVLTTLAMHMALMRISPNITAATSLRYVLLCNITSYILTMAFFPPIAQKRIVKAEEIIKRCIATGVLFFVLVNLIQNLWVSQHIAVGAIAVFALIYMTILCVERLAIRKFIKKLRSNKKNMRCIVFAGNTGTTAELYNILNTTEYGYNIQGVFYDEQRSLYPEEVKKLGGIDDIIPYLNAHNEIKEIYGYFDKADTEKLLVLSKWCDNHLIRLHYVPSTNIFGGKTSIVMKEDIMVIARRPEPLSLIQNKIIKRTFDFVMSSLFLCTIYPFIYIICAIIIKIQSPGPIYFKQERSGLNGKIFKCYKFRSMKVNDDADKVQATENDPRKYPFGNFMRKTNLDEIPQLINVWKGEMSLVGPRPHMLKHTEEYSRIINRFMVRHLAKPGITGLAQVSGFRGETKYINTMEGRVKKDIEYIENWTFLLDLKIIVKTFTNMIHGEKNAY